MKPLFLTSVMALSLSLAVVSCQTSMAPTQLGSTGDAESATSQRVSAVTPARSYPALNKQHASGSLRLDKNTLTLTLHLPELPEAQDTQPFATQKLDLSTTTKLFAQVSDSHGKTYAPTGADGDGAVNYTGGTITLTFNNLTPDELLFVDVQAKNGTTPIPQAQLATVIKHTTDATPVNATLNFQTAVAAKALKAMLLTHATQARSIDLTALNTLTASITGVSGTAPNFTYSQNHPSLVHTALLATHLQSQAPIDLTAADYRQSGATVNLTVSGLTGSDKVQVQITDAASAVRTDLGNGTIPITGVTPGSGLTAIVTPFGAPSQTYNYSINPTSLTLTEGNSTNLTITATPTMTLTNISPANGPAGTTVTITGTGFTGATDVSFNGSPAASFTIINDTQIVATVPVTATDGTISVTKGGTTKYSTDFDVYRVIFVKADAVGANTGQSWANAHPSLQTALSASQPNDDIWIAAGKYIPGTNRNDSFSLRQNVDIYGGFNGTETSLAARNFETNVVILSGDIDNNDNYSTTPAGNISGNSYHVVKGGNATLDGVTIQGGNANDTVGSIDSMGAGLYAQSVIVGNLRNVIFKHNNANDRGAGLLAENALGLRMNNVIFQHCSAYREGVVLALFSAEVLEAKNIIFDQNQASDNTSGSSVASVDVLLNSWVLENSSFTNNSGLEHILYVNAYHTSGTPTTLALKNSLMANNIARVNSVRLVGDSSGTLQLNNTTLANNLCAAQESGFCLAERVIQAPNVSFSVNNALYWRDSINLPGTGSNNIDLGSGGTPFIDSTDPDGPDNIFFTADDGYNLAAGNAGIDAGNTNADVPDKDIVGRDRVGDTDAGAYEYQAPAAPPASNFTITGTTANDKVGHSVSGAGDLNNDGFDDFIVGAHGTNSSTGKTYVVFGNASLGSGGGIALASLDGSNGFVLNGEANNDQSGYNVSGAGDVNNDGFADLIIGASGANSSTGKTYVVFGGTNVGASGSLNLSSLNGTNGFVLNGEATGDQSGVNVSAAGDINNDSVDDLMIGAFNANGFAGKTYVVFGGTNLGSGGSLNLSTLNGTNGFDINGANASDASGGNVSAAGDVNNDGVDDLIIGAYGPNSYAGKSYVIFGGTNIGSTGSLALSSLNGTNGFSLNGENGNDYSGISVSGAGDVNNDGFDDLMVGAYGFNSTAGKSYVIFGGTNIGSTGSIALSSLNGSNGFSLTGENTSDYLGISVSSAGDLNNDGFDDLIAGASNFNSSTGKSYVIFGGTNVGSSGSINLSSLNGTNGFALNGEATGDQSGLSVSNAGDLNNDGFADLLIGAYGKNSFAGKAYVVFGSLNLGSTGSLNLSAVGN